MIDVSPTQDKLNFKKILPIFVIVLIDLLGMTIIIPLMPLYATAFGANPILIGLLGAIYPIMQFIGAPILGRLSDRYGRKPVLLVSQLGTLVGFLVLGFASTLWMLFLSRLIDGISGANISTAQAAISDSTNEKTRTQGMGLIGAAFGLGFIIGPVIAFLALAVSHNNYHVPAMVAAVFSLLSILLTWFWFEETLPEEKRGQGNQNASFTLGSMFKAITHPAVGILLVLIFAQQIAFGGFEQMLALFTLTRLGVNAAGNAIIFVFTGIIVVAVQGGFIGPWNRKYGDRRMIYAGLGLLAVGLCMIAFTPHMPVPWYSQSAMHTELASGRSARAAENPATQTLPVQLPSDATTGWLGIAWLLAAMVPTAIGGGLLQPTINSSITKRISKDEIGGMLGISAAFLSAANAIAPLVWGLLFQAVGPSAPFVLSAVLLAVLWLVARRSIKPADDEILLAGLVQSPSG